MQLSASMLRMGCSFGKMDTPLYSGRNLFSHRRSSFVPSETLVYPGGWPRKYMSMRDMNKRAGRHTFAIWFMRPASLWTSRLFILERLLRVSMSVTISWSFCRGICRNFSCMENLIPNQTMSLVGVPPCPQPREVQDRQGGPQCS